MEFLDNPAIYSFDFNGEYIGYVIDNSTFEKDFKIKVFIPELFGYEYKDSIKATDSINKINSSKVNSKYALNNDIISCNYIECLPIVNNFKQMSKEEFYKSYRPEIGDKVTVSFMDNDPSRPVYDNERYIEDPKDVNLVDDEEDENRNTGVIVVNNLIERDSIPLEDRFNGLTVLVKDNGEEVPVLYIWADGEWIASGSGGGSGGNSSANNKLEYSNLMPEGTKIYTDENNDVIIILNYSSDMPGRPTYIVTYNGREIYNQKGNKGQDIEINIGKFNYGMHQIRVTALDSQNIEPSDDSLKELIFFIYSGSIRLSSDFVDTYQESILEINSRMVIPYTIQLVDSEDYQYTNINLKVTKSNDSSFSNTLKKVCGSLQNSNGELILENGIKGLFPSKTSDEIRGNYNLELYATVEKENGYSSSSIILNKSFLIEGEISVEGKLNIDKESITNKSYLVLQYKLTTTNTNITLYGIRNIYKNGVKDDNLSAGITQTSLTNGNYYTWNIGSLLLNATETSATYKIELIGATDNEVAEGRYEKCIEPLYIEFVVRQASTNKKQYVVERNKKTILLANFDCDGLNNENNNNGEWVANNGIYKNKWFFELNELIYKQDPVYKKHPVTGEEIIDPETGEKIIERFVGNGWYEDYDNGMDDDNSYQRFLRLNAKSYGILKNKDDKDEDNNPKPVYIMNKSLNTISDEGFTFECLFRTKCNGDLDAKALTCFNGIRDGASPVGGFNITYNKFNFSTSTNSMSVGFLEDEWIHVAYVFDPKIRTDQSLYDLADTNYFATIRIYINGVFAKCMKLSSASEFGTNSNSSSNFFNFYLNYANGHLGDSDFKYIRFYNTALYSSEIIQNYISTKWILLEQEKLDNLNNTTKTLLPIVRFTRMKESGFASDPSHKNSDTFDRYIHPDSPNPSKPIISDGINTIEDRTASKNRYVKCKVDIDYRKEINLEFNNVIKNDNQNFIADIYLQGTSSLQYPKKNFTIRDHKDKNNPYSDNDPIYKVLKSSNKLILDPDMKWIPEKKWTLKCDYMEASHRHNTGTAKLLHKIYDNLGYYNPCQKYIFFKHDIDPATSMLKRNVSNQLICDFVDNESAEKYKDTIFIKDKDNNYIIPNSNEFNIKSGSMDLFDSMYYNGRESNSNNLAHPMIRSTIDGFPCIVFYNDDYTGNPENEVYAGTYMFNLDKGSEMFGFDKDFYLNTPYIFASNPYSDHYNEFLRNYNEILIDEMEKIGTPIPDIFKDLFKEDKESGEYVVSLSDVENFTKNYNASLSDTKKEEFIEKACSNIYKCLSYEGVANTSTSAGAFHKFAYNDDSTKPKADGKIVDTNVDSFNGIYTSYKNNVELSTDEKDFLYGSFEERFDDLDYGANKRVVDWVDNASFEFWGSNNVDDWNIDNLPKANANGKWGSSNQYDINRFKKEFSQYFDFNFCLLYYVQTMTFGMVDNCGKNAMFTTWDGIHWFPEFYDMDTLAGLDNIGDDRINPDAEMNVIISPQFIDGKYKDQSYYSTNHFYYTTDYITIKPEELDEGETIEQRLESLKEADPTIIRFNRYNTFTSKLWLTFAAVYSDVFARQLIVNTDIERLYNNLRNTLYNYDNLISHYNEVTQNIGQIYYNRDMIAKYVNIDSTDADIRLKNNLLGNREIRFKNWLKKRLLYQDSFWYYASETFSSNIEMRAEKIMKPVSSEPLPNDEIGNLGITVFDPCYIYVDIASSRDSRIRGYVSTDSKYKNFFDNNKASEGTLFSFPVDGVNKEMYITGIGNIKEINFINKLQLSSLGIKGACKIVKINLSNSSKLSSLSLGENTFLQELNLNNCTSLKETTIDLTDSPNIKVVNIANSGIQGIVVGKGSSLESLNASTVTNLTTINLENLEYFETLTIKDCPEITTVNIINVNRLKTLDLSKTNIQTLYLDRCNQLEELILDDCDRLDSLSIIDCPNLVKISFKNTNASVLKALNLSTIRSLKILDITNCSAGSTTEPINIAFPISLGSDPYFYLEEFIATGSRLKTIGYGSEIFNEDKTINTSKVTEGVVDLRKCKYLYNLNISNCKEIEEIKFIEEINLNFPFKNPKKNTYQTLSEKFNDCRKLKKVTGNLYSNNNDISSLFKNCFNLEDITGMNLNFNNSDKTYSFNSLFSGARLKGLTGNDMLKQAKNYIINKVKSNVTSVTIDSMFYLGRYLSFSNDEIMNQIECWGENAQYIKLPNYLLCRTEGSIHTNLPITSCKSVFYGRWFDSSEKLQYLFNGSTNLSNINSCESMFTCHYGLVEIHKNFFDSIKYTTSYEGIFATDTNVKDDSTTVNGTYNVTLLKSKSLQILQPLNNGSIFATITNNTDNINARCMFQDCKALNLSNFDISKFFCQNDGITNYQRMFANNISLTFGNTIPPTYNFPSLFTGMKKLEDIRLMFQNCTALTFGYPSEGNSLFTSNETETLSKLTKCGSFFDSCSNLCSMNENCNKNIYSDFFRGLPNISSLRLDLNENLSTYISGSTITTSNYTGFFKGCPILSLSADIFKYIKNITSLRSFMDRTVGLTTIISENDKEFINIFDDMPNLNNISMFFYDCKNLNMVLPVEKEGTILKSLFQPIKDTLVNCSYFFCNCKLLRTGIDINGVRYHIPSELLNYSPQLTSANALFLYCSNIQGKVPEDIFRGCTKLNYVQEFFRGCTSLQSEDTFANSRVIPNDFFEDCPIVNVSHFFNGCTNLKGYLDKEVTREFLIGPCYETKLDLEGNSYDELVLTDKKYVTVLESKSLFCNKTSLTSTAYFFNDCVNITSSRFPCMMFYSGDLFDIETFDEFGDEYVEGKEFPVQIYNKETEAYEDTVYRILKRDQYIYELTLGSKKFEALTDISYMFDGGGSVGMKAWGPINFLVGINTVTEYHMLHPDLFKNCSGLIYINNFLDRLSSEDQNGNVSRKVDSSIFEGSSNIQNASSFFKQTNPIMDLDENFFRKSIFSLTNISSMFANSSPTITFYPNTLCMRGPNYTLTNMSNFIGNSGKTANATATSIFPKRDNFINSNFVATTPFGANNSGLTCTNSDNYDGGEEQLKKWGYTVNGASS